MTENQIYIFLLVKCLGEVSNETLNKFAVWDYEIREMIDLGYLDHDVFTNLYTATDSIEVENYLEKKLKSFR